MVAGSQRGRLATAVLVVLALATHPAAATAGLQATASAGTPTGTARWGAVFTNSSLLGGATGALTTVLTGDSYPYLTNSGTATLGPRFAVVVSLTATGGASASLETCDGTWDEVLGTCSGTARTVATTAAPGPVDGALVAAPGSSIRLRLHPGAGSAGQSATLSVAVTAR